MAALYSVDFQVATNEDLVQDFVAESDNVGTGFDLTGATIKMDVDLDGAEQFEASTANGRIAITGASGGEFTLQLDATLIATLSPGVYRHDCIITTPAGKDVRLWAGWFRVIEGVTS